MDIIERTPYRFHLRFVFKSLSYQDNAVNLVEEPEKENSKGTAKIWDFLIPSAAPSNLKIAFINAKNPETSNWTYSHELGRLHVEQALAGKVTTTHIDNANTSEEAMKAIELAISAGNTVIFTTTPQMVPRPEYPGLQPLRGRRGGILRTEVHLQRY